MKLKYLGTAASEGWPALFCQCDACKEAARRGGRDLRLRAGALVDGEVLLDFTPDLMAQRIMYDLPLADIRHCFITHTHEDHFEPRTLCWFGPGFATINDRERKGKLHFYASAGSRPDFEKKLYGAVADADKWCDLTTLEPYQRVEIDGRGFTPIPAVHGCAGAVNYIIDAGGRRIVYAHDTGIWKDEVWEFMRGMRFDMVSLDCTSGPMPMSYDGHMNFERNEIVKDRMLESGMADGNTRFVLNHFSHNGGMLYDEMARAMGHKGFEISYDGMEIEV